MEHKKILKESIKSHQEAIDKAKAELAKLEKPELRHGDYGYDYEGNCCIAMNDDEGCLCDCSESYLYEMEGEDYHVVTKLGNIFDDLKRNKEDLTDFKVKTLGVSSSFQAFQHGSDIYILSMGYYYDLDKATEIHQKLGQLIATIKRKTKP